MLTTRSVVLSVPMPLLGAGRFTAQCVRSVGQDVSPGMCVLLRAHEAMGCFWRW